MTFLGTVCLSYSYTLSLETGAKIRAGEEKSFISLYTFYFHSRQKDCVSFPLTDPVHPLCCPRQITIATYISIYRTFIHTYTPSKTLSGHRLSFPTTGASQVPLKNDHWFVL